MRGTIYGSDCCIRPSWKVVHSFVDNSLILSSHDNLNEHSENLSVIGFSSTNIESGIHERGLFPRYSNANQCSILRDVLTMHLEQVVIPFMANARNALHIRPVENRRLHCTLDYPCTVVFLFRSYCVSRRVVNEPSHKVTTHIMTDAICTLNERIILV